MISNTKYANKTLTPSPCLYTIYWLYFKHEVIFYLVNSGLTIQTLTQWGRVTHICVGNHTIIGSDNGLSPSRRQAIIWINAGILLIGPLETNFNEILIEIHIFSFNENAFEMVVCEMAAILSRPQRVNIQLSALIFSMVKIHTLPSVAYICRYQ